MQRLGVQLLFDYEKQAMQTPESEDPTDGFQDPQIDMMTTEAVIVTENSQIKPWHSHISRGYEHY